MRIGRWAAALAVVGVVGLLGLPAHGAGAVAAAAAAPPAQPPPATKVDAWVLAATEGGLSAPVLVLLADQADLRRAPALRDPLARGWYAYTTLHDQAERGQRGLRGFLDAYGIAYQPFWAANAIALTADRALVDWLAARPDVRAVEANRPLRGVPPQPEGPLLAPARPRAAQAVEWGVANVRAPEVWARGYVGQNVVIGVQDTGVQWDHPALRAHYRGWNGATADHSYHWHDAIHSASANPCGVNAPAPCDDDGHGTHVTGTTVGDDGAGNQIGVAPGARWIGCRNMARGVGTPSTYIECFQFFIAPTDLAGANPDPARRPHVVNNSWLCPPSEGCAAGTLHAVVANTQAAGIFVVGAAGNEGPGCSTVQDPPALYGETFSVGAYASDSTLASFSSRGPVTSDGSGRLKPDLSAPGVGVRSAYPPSTYAVLSGTSMASPHVAGVVALLWAARPELLRDVAATRGVLLGTANPGVFPSAFQTCGGTPSSVLPNNSVGHGRVDALAAAGPPLPTATPTPTPTPTLNLPPTPTSPPTATPSPTATPTAAPTPTSCALPGRLAVQAVPNGDGRLRVTITAGGTGNSLQAIGFANDGQVVGNGLIDTTTQTGQPLPLTVALPSGPTSYTFWVRRIAPDQATTVALTVQDRCGPWPTLVGGGPGSF